MEVDTTYVPTANDAVPPSGEGGAPRNPMHLKRELHHATGNPTPWWWLVLAGATSLLLGLGALASFWLFARPLAFLVLAVTIAAALAPPVNLLARKIPRVVAVVAVYLVLVGLLALLAYFVLPSFVTEMRQFGNRLPELVGNVQQWLMGLIPPEEDVIPVDEGSVFNMISSWLSGFGTQVLSLPLTLTAAALDGLLVIFLSLYALIWAPNTRHFLRSLTPRRAHARVESIASEMFEAMGGYFRGVFISGVIVAALTYVGLLLIGVDFALALAITAGLLEFVPVFGPIVAGILVVSVAFLQSGGTALAAFAYMVILQQIESNILFPNILSNETSTSPFLSLFAFFAGVAVGGLLGALIAVPLAAALRVFVIHVVAPGVRQLTGAPEDNIPTT